QAVNKLNDRRIVRFNTRVDRNFCYSAFLDFLLLEAEPRCLHTSLGGNRIEIGFNIRITGNAVEKGFAIERVAAFFDLRQRGADFFTARDVCLEQLSLGCQAIALRAKFLGALLIQLPEVARQSAVRQQEQGESNAGPSLPGVPLAAHVLYQTTRLK